MCRCGALVLFLLLNSDLSRGTLPEDIFGLISDNFKSIDGAYLYFCELEDAEEGFRRLLTDRALPYNVRYIPDNYEPKELLVNLWQPQRIGVFLDLSCDRGLNILKRSEDLMNASYSWLVWSPGELNTSLLEESRLSADSEFRVVRPGLVLYDLFRFHSSSRMVLTPIARWNTTTGHVSLGLAPNRTDFGGLVFNASLMMIDIKFNKSNLIAPLLDKTYESGKDMVRRYGLAVFIHLAEMYNFSYRYVLTDAWGDPLPNGSVTGMVGQVMRGEAEFGLAPAKYILPRYAIIDYISSLYIVRACFTFLQPKLLGSAMALILPLDADVWYSLAGLSVIAIIVFRILGKYDHTGTSNDNWGGSFLLVVGAVSQQGIPDTTDKTSTRIVYVFLLVSTFFTAIYYNTAILNGLLLQAPNAIQNIEQLLKSDTKLGVVDIPYFRNEMILIGSALCLRELKLGREIASSSVKGQYAEWYGVYSGVIMFGQRQNDSLTIRVLEKISKGKSKKMYYAVPEGVAKIKKGRFALYTEDEAIYTELQHQMTDAEICSISEVTKYNPFHVGAVAKKNGPYKELFNRAFTLMRERGILNRQLAHWTEKKPECHWRQDALTLGLEPLAVAYVAFSLGLIAALLFLGFELLLHRRRENLKILSKLQ